MALTEKLPAHVRVLRLGAAARHSQETRVRWAYAIQCSDADAVLEKLAALTTDGALGAQEVQALLADLPIDRVLAGAGEIQSVARHDAGLRRALRAARESMRGEETADGLQKIAPDRDKGAV